MPGMTAEEAFQQFQQNGQYANNPSHFASDEEWAKYKEMVPKEAKKAFREKVAGNENRAIEGLMQGKTREQMGIRDVKEEGQALYRRLGAGLGTGLDMNRAYDWGGGTATNVGTSDLFKRGIEQRGITDTERQRHADFSAAGNPEAFWQAYRGNQISGLLNSGAIAKDENGYYNPGPGGGDRYGANLEGYNLGRGVMGNGSNLGGPAGVGNLSGTFNGGGTGPNYHGQGGGPIQQYAPGSYQSPTWTPPPAPAASSPSTTSTPSPGLNLPSYTPPANNSGFTGGMENLSPAYSKAGSGAASGNLTSLLSNKNNGGNGAIYAADGYANPNMPAGPLPDGGTPLVVHPGENVNVTPANQNPAAGGAPPANGHAGPQFGLNLGPNHANNATTREIGPGGSALPGSSPFGSNPVPLPPNGVPGSTQTAAYGSGGYQGSSLPGIGMPGQIPLSGSDPTRAPGGSGLASQGGVDTAGQRFNYDRARGEYGGAQALEGGLLGIYGDILGFDPATGQQRGASDSNNRSFAYLAPQAQRVAGDADALVKRLEATLPPGGERDAAIASALRGAQSDISGGRQALMQQALTGVSDLAQSKKQFDPQYTGANQSLLDAYGNLRGQDLSTQTATRGQDLQGLLGARGQDVSWGLGQGQLGLGYDQLSTQQQQNLWNQYLTGRGQDMDYYGNIRGQDLQSLQNRQANQTQQQGNRSQTIGQVAAAAGTIAVIA